MKKYIVSLAFASFALAAFMFFSSPRSAEAAYAAHPPGTLVNSYGTISLVSDDQTKLLGIPSLEVFLSNRFNLDDAPIANVADENLQQGSMVTWGDGVLFLQNGTVWQVANGQKYGFTSADVFTGLGYEWRDVVGGDVSSLPTGPAINSTAQAHKPGTFIIDSTNTVWRISRNNTREGIPQWAMFLSYRVPFDQVVPANAADMALPVGGVILYQKGAIILDPANTIWLSNGISVSGFPTWACYANYFYNSSRLIKGSVAGIRQNNTACASTAEGNGISFNKFTVPTSGGNLIANTVSADSNRVRIATDTLANGDCNNNCPTAKLDKYVANYKALAAINGTYFCPRDYATCSTERDSFFWKIYDSNTRQMIVNSPNGANDPFIVTKKDGSIALIDQWSQWNASTTPITAGLNHKPLLVKNSTIVLDVNSLDDKQRNTRSLRSFLGYKNGMIVAVVVQNATVPHTAEVAKNMGLEFAIELDGGGSSALFANGQYFVTGGREIPNAILFMPR